MKKILLVMSVIAVLFLAGCQNNDNVNNNVPQDEVNQEQEEIVENNDESTHNNSKSGEVNIDIDNKLNSSDTANDHIDTNLQIHEDDIFPYSSLKIIDEKDYYANIECLELDELEIANNEIFARHGHEFSSKYLLEYFNNKEWYKPIKGKKVSVSELNEIEQKNIEIINKRIAYLKEEVIIFENDKVLFIGSHPTAERMADGGGYEYSIYTNDSGKFVVKIRWDFDKVHYYLNNNILSVLIIAPWANGVDCYVHNIDVLNKNEISDEKLIEIANENYSKCIEKVKKITLNHICSEEEYKEIKILAESDDNWDENAWNTMIEKYNIAAYPASIISTYEYELQNDSSVGTHFYLNENGDICFVRYYEDGVGSQSGGAYMYNLSKDKEINEFGVYCG